MCNISQGIREEAYNEAYEEARAEWLAKGMEKGIEEGYEKRNLEIAKRMFMKNMPIEEIIEFTELPRQTILDLGKS